MRSFYRFSLIPSILVLALLGGCQGGGTVSVSHPLVHTRERLVEERVREDTWLRSQLAQTENLEPVFSGYHDWRQFIGLYSETKAALDPSLGLANTLQQQNDRAQQLTYQTQLERDLLREREALRKDREAITAAREAASREPNAKPATPSPSTTPATAPAAPAKLSGPSLPTGSGAFGTSLSDLPGPPDSSAPAQTKTQFSFIDKFNTRLAARTMINAALRANSLDDSHDAAGLELYELTLHTSLVPSCNNGDLAQVTLEIVPLPPEKRVEDMRRLFVLWQDSLREQLIAQVAEIQYHLREGRIDVPTRELLEWFLARRLVTLGLQLQQEEQGISDIYGRLETLLVQLEKEYEQRTKTPGSGFGRLETLLVQLKEEYEQRMEAPGSRNESSGPTNAWTEPVKVADFYGLLNDAADHRLYHLLSPDVEKAVRDILRVAELHDQVLAVAAKYGEDGSLSPHAREHIHKHILDRPVLELVRSPAQRERVYELVVTAGDRIAAGLDCQTGYDDRYRRQLATALALGRSPMTAAGSVPSNPNVYGAYREFREAYERLLAKKPRPVIFDPNHRVDPDYRPFLMQAAAWAIWSQYVDQLGRFVYVTGPAFGPKRGGERTEEESTLQGGFAVRDVASFTDDSRLARMLDRHTILVLRESSLGSTGYAAFFDRLNELEQQPFALTVQPKQDMQLVSEAAARETVLNMILGLSASLPTSGVAASTQNQFLNRMREISHGITRQPLIVGFGQGQKQFGWVMGPEFEISEGECKYRHATARYDCAAGIVVPGWWSTIWLRGHAAWIDATTGTPRDEKPLWENKIEKLPLRMPSAGLVAITTALMSNHPSTEPSACPTRPGPRLRKPPGNQTEPQTLCATRPGEKAPSEQTLLLLGEDLWRSPQVFVGSYRATRVDVLPSMNGLLAYFDTLPVPEALFEKKPTGVLMRLRVVTAFGSDEALGGVTVLPPPKAVAKAPTPPKLISTFVDDQSKDLVFEYERPASFAELFLKYRNPAKPADGLRCPAPPQWGKNNSVSFALGALDNSKKAASEILEANLYLLARPDEGLPPTELMPSYQKFARFATVADRSFVLTKPKVGDTLEYNENGALPKGTKIEMGGPKSRSEVFEVAYPGWAAAVQQKALQLEFLEEKGDKSVTAVDVAISTEDKDTIQLSVASGQDAPLSSPKFRDLVTAGDSNEHKLKLRLTYRLGEKPTVTIPVVDAAGQPVGLIFKAKSKAAVSAVVTNATINFTYKGDMKSELVFTITPPMSPDGTRLDFIGSAALTKARTEKRPVSLELQTQTGQTLSLDLTVREKIEKGEGQSKTESQPKIELALAAPVGKDKAGKLAEWCRQSAETPLRTTILVDKDIKISVTAPGAFFFTMDPLPAAPAVQLTTPQVKEPGSDGKFPQPIVLLLPKPKTGESYEGHEDLVKRGGVRVLLLNKYKESIELTPDFRERGEYYIYSVHAIGAKQLEKLTGDGWRKDTDSFGLRMMYGVTATDSGHPLEVPTAITIK